MATFFLSLPLALLNFLTIFVLTMSLFHHLIKDLISVRQFTTDNNCSVEFDPLGCSVKDLPTWRVILRCDSFGPLYPLRSTTSSLHATTSSLWHQRLGHPGSAVLTQLAQSSAIPCTPNKHTPLCHACQLGRHVHLPFHSSSSHATRNFQLIHCDLWTSPITSVSGHKYYLAILDDCSHYLWTFPLRLKSDTFSTLTNFFAYVRTQFGILVSPSRVCNVTMVANSIISTLAIFSPPMEFFYACLVLTLPRKMARPNALFAPSIMSSARFSSKPASLPLSGLLLLVLPHIS
jgi:hypothetical protein